MPDIWMDVDTALAEVPVNILPLTDDTDFKAREIAIAYNAAGMDLVWNFTTTAGAFTQTAVTPTTAGDYDWTHQGDGMYTIEIPASAGVSINNDTEGFGWFTGLVTGVLSWRGPTIGLRDLAVNNALVDGGDSLDVNVTQLGGVAQSATDLKDFADAGYDPGTNKVQGVVLVDTTTTNTDMRGTDNAALASVLGALADAAAGGDPTASDTIMQYIKQLVNVLIGTTGVVTFPAEAPPANNVSLAEIIRAIHSDVTGLNGSSMRGTDSAALASVATEARLAELDAANMPTDLSTIQGRLPTVLVGGRMDSDVAAIQAGAITAAAIATNAVDADSLAADAVSEIQSGLATSTNQTTILNRIGAFTTGGVNDILGFFKALMRSDATTPSDVGGTYDDGTDSLQAVRDRGDTDWTTGAGGSPPDLLQNTTIATLASQTSFTLTAGSGDNNAYNGAIAVVTDSATSTQKAVGIISGYTGSTKTVTLQSDPGVFIMAVGDTIDIVATDTLSLVYTAARAGYLDNLNGHTPQTGDSYARLGAPAGASVSADIAAVEGQTDDIGVAGAGLTALPWNAAWDAQVESEVTDALVAYDPPTNTEMIARTLVSASYFAPGTDNVIVGTNNDKTDYALSSTNRQAMVDDILDEVISKSAHNDPNSVGKYIRRIASSFVWEGTAQGPGTGTNQIQLDTGASSVNGAYDPSAIAIVDGTGAGQSRLVLEYDGPSRTATVDRDWKVLPDATSEFIVVPNAGRGHVNEGLAQGGTTNTITLNSLASSVNGVYARQRIFIVSGTGADQVGRGVAYNGTTKVLTVAQTWNIQPDTTSGYVMLPDAPSLFQGYESAAIWIDTINGTAGTVLYENGTAENPVASLADATTLATNLGFSEFRVAPGSTLTLAQSYDGFTIGSINSNGWTLNLGVQSISGTTIIGATVSGVCSGASKPTFISCSMGAVTIPASRILNCAISGTQTMSGTGDFFYEGCYSGIAGTSSPSIIFSASSNLNFRHYSGGVHVQSMAATNNMSLEGHGQLTLNVNCTGGTIAIRGHFTVIDNAGGAVVLSDDARIDIGQINTQADQALSDYDPPTNTEMVARTLLAASYGTAAAQVAMQADLDNPNQYKADVSALALEATVAALNNITVSDILTATISERTQQAPPATPTVEDAMMYLYMALRNKIDVTSDFKEFHNDAGSVIWKKAVSDDLTTYIETKGETGP